MVINRKQVDVIGLIPAGGQAKRLSPIPCSKEIYPVGYETFAQERDKRPKAVCQYLFDTLRHAGIEKAHIILRPGKWDVPEFLGDGSRFGMHLSYLVSQITLGVPYTLDQAYALVKDFNIAFGFPDIIIEPVNVFERLLQERQKTGADIILGLFPVEDHTKCDLVDIDSKGKVSMVLPKPITTDLRYTWLLAVWTPVFTKFMHEYLNILHKPRPEQSEQLVENKELFLGDVIQAAIESGLEVMGKVFERGSYIDIGTPDDLIRAVNRYATNQDIK